MNVKQLRQKLKEFDPKLRVYINGQEAELTLTVAYENPYYEEATFSDKEELEKTKKETEENIEKNVRLLKGENCNRCKTEMTDQIEADKHYLNKIKKVVPVLDIDGYNN